MVSQHDFLSVAESDDEAPRDEIRQPERRERAQPDRSPVGKERPDGKPQDDDKQPESKKKSLGDWIREHRIAVIIGIVVFLIALVALVLWWLDARHYESTDDAFIDGRPVSISAQVSGAVVDVPVTDNQIVEQGAVLAKIDDRDYRASLLQAEAQIEQARAGIANAEAQLGTQQARIDQAAKQMTEAEAALTFSKDENTRYQDLVNRGAGTLQRAQQASSDLQQKQAALDAAAAAKTQAEKQQAVLEAQRETAVAQLHAAEGQRDQAQANLSRTTLTAPVKGRVTKLTGAKGAFATPGQALMIIVPTTLWVTANYKETQLADMRPGQPVTISVDALGRSFPGHVDSIQAGSGTVFSLLPAQNATGNYVKVVQRVPVKIVFDNPPDVELGPGMSVVPSAKVR